MLYISFCKRDQFPRVKPGRSTGVSPLSQLSTKASQLKRNTRTMASYMLKHDGKLDRWCPVQPDVEAYFRQTLEQVIPTSRLCPEIPFPCFKKHCLVVVCLLCLAPSRPSVKVHDSRCGPTPLCGTTLRACKRAGMCRFYIHLYTLRLHSPCSGRRIIWRQNFQIVHCD